MPAAHRSRRWLVRIAAALAVAVAGLAFAFWLVFRPTSWGNPAPIPQGFGYSRVPAFVGAPAEPRPLASFPLPRHPFIAASNSNNMHGDAYATDTHARGGPLGRDPEVRSAAQAALGGECAAVAFDRRGRIVTVCGTFTNFLLLLLDAGTLETLARLELPPRPSNRSLDLRRIMSDTSGGAYFYLDHRDRAVLVDAEQRLRVLAQEEQGGRTRFVEHASHDLRPVLREMSRPDDVVTAVLPDWQGRHWFVSRGGLVGWVDGGSGHVRALALPGEEIQNSFAVAPDGVYVVSDHAMYRLGVSAGTGEPIVEWREAYDRGTAKKVGSVAQGSGTTPTLVGDDYVAITDDADARVHLLVYRRALDARRGRLVCRVPLFAPGRSATDNSLIAVGRSLIAENNHGYDLFTTMMFGRTGSGGVERVDIEPDGSGCSKVWSSPEISQTTVPKASLATGLVYLYTKAPDAPWGVDAYYLTALDFETGATRFKVLTGTGVAWDNNWAPITLGDDGTAYVGTLRGLVLVRDRPPQ